MVVVWLLYSRARHQRQRPKTRVGASALHERQILSIVFTTSALSASRTGSHASGGGGHALTEGRIFDPRVPNLALLSYTHPPRPPEFQIGGVGGREGASARSDINMTIDFTMAYVKLFATWS